MLNPTIHRFDVGSTESKNMYFYKCPSRLAGRFAVKKKKFKDIEKQNSNHQT